MKLNGIIWDGLIFAGFIYLLLVMLGRVKPPQPVPFIQNASFFVTLIIYLGVALFGCLLIMDLI